jgi:hypothetical protein
LRAGYGTDVDWSCYFRPRIWGFLPLPECPLLAQSGHPELQCTCPLSGAKQTCRFALQMSAYDP